MKHCIYDRKGELMNRRSREGAWIETMDKGIAKINAERRSREGAWIETNYGESAVYSGSVAPMRERGLKQV